MSLTSITVLCPNARRVPIKVTPSTLLRKVLEEACLTNGFDPARHQLEHHNKPLDLSLPLRLSGLPNNATLELVESTCFSGVQEVIVALQLSTTRHEVKCRTSDSLLEVLRLAAQSSGIDLITSNEDGSPACSYMSKQYRGESELDFRTLSSIGVTGGRILIRYVRLQLDDSKLAEIETIISNEKVERERLEKVFWIARKENEARLKKEEHEERQIMLLRQEEEERQREKAEKATTNLISASIPDRLPSEAAPAETGWAFDSPFVPPIPALIATVPVQHANTTIIPAPRSARIEALEALLQNVNQALDSRSASSSIVDTVAEVGRIPVANVHDVLGAGGKETKSTEPLPVKCDRQAVVFSALKREEKGDEELGDEFYELTVDDLKNMQKGHRASVLSQTERALLPRKILDERNEERKLAAWKHVVIRFKLPNEVIVQGSFLPHEPACHLHEFLGLVIEAPFTLRFITSKISQDEKRSIVALDLAPKATLVVSCGDCGEVSIKENAARQVTYEEAEGISNAWLTVNSSFVPYSPTVAPESGHAAQKRAADLSSSSHQRVIPESIPSGPKWLKKK